MIADDIKQRIRRVLGDGRVELHEPVLGLEEKSLLLKCIESGFISSAGAYVNELEVELAKYIGVKSAVCVNSGTSALHLALLAVGANNACEVIVPALGFVALPNAISYCGAEPVFLDVEMERLGLCPNALLKWLEQNAKVVNKCCYNRRSGKKIVAVAPVHLYGTPSKMSQLKAICDEFYLHIVEDGAEAFGSHIGDRHVGSDSEFCCFSFNGNKIITGGCGGLLISNDQAKIDYVRHLSTTAKIDHRFRLSHDEIGFNYRLTNLNAAVILAQLKKLESFLIRKRGLHQRYLQSFETCEYAFIVGAPDAVSPNFWLNTLIIQDPHASFIEDIVSTLISDGINVRRCWDLLADLPMFKSCQRGPLTNSNWLQSRIISLPSGASL